MGKVILCVGQTAPKPFVFKTTGIPIYTIEELCYYIYHNISSALEELYNPELIEFIGRDLKLTKRAQFLKELVDKKAGCKDLVVSIICSADYYDKSEIDKLLLEIDVLFQMTPIQRKKRQADQCLMHKQWKEAMRQYRSILNSKEFAELTSEDYGDILHNIGVLEVRTGAFSQAAVRFREGYERNGKEASLIQYFYALKLSKQDTLVKRELDLYENNQMLTMKMEERLNQVARTREYTAMYVEVTKLKELRERGAFTEYYKKLDDLIESLIVNYKKNSL